MIYACLFITLSLLMLAYFRIANHFNIIDKPNQRSSHTVITIRGGGIIFYIAACGYFIWSGFRYPFFFAGLTGIACISFLDDMFTLTNRLRICIHIVSVALLLQEAHYLHQAWYFIVIGAFVIIGIINAFNFMDGINGMTTAYSFTVLLLLWWANEQFNFIEPDLLAFIAVGNLVFAFFNFRKKAACFAGDVGSVTMSYILVFAVLMLILRTQSLLYILFLCVYGVDASLTIAGRLLRKENIFEAHRSHLYQYLSNEAKINQLFISSAYALIQLVIGIGVFFFQHYSVETQLAFTFLTLLLLSLTYVFLKNRIAKRYMN